MVNYSVNGELYHHGVMGMKWGVRRFQNSDGTLTEAGKKRYEKIEKNPKRQAKETEKARKFLNRVSDNAKDENLSKAAVKKLKDIDDGKIRAGKDFIVQRDYNVWPIANVVPFGWAVGSYASTIITNAHNAKTKPYKNGNNISYESVNPFAAWLFGAHSRTETLIERKK